MESRCERRENLICYLKIFVNKHCFYVYLIDFEIFIDILLCENITREMDVYDTAFVIDYLRDWAMKLNRIVLMAVAPPTIEILTMFHKGTFYYQSFPISLRKRFLAWEDHRNRF